MHRTKCEAPPGRGGASRNISQRAAAKIDYSELSCLSVSRQGPRHIGEIAEEVLNNLRFRRQFEHLHRLGPRAVGELLLEVADHHDIELVLARYARLDPDILKALGGDKFSPPPIYEVQR